MHIVLDANIIIAEGYGDSDQFQILLSNLDNLHHRLYVPQSVIEEVVAKFERDYDEDTREISRRMRNLSWRLNRRLPSPIDGLDGENESTLFRRRLEERFSGSNCMILGYPDISHEELVRRASARVKPFNEEGAGYRDTLIWESVLGLAAEVDSDVILLSNDRDFRRKRGGLHSDLVSQLRSHGLPRNKVKLVSSLRDFVATYIRPSLPEGTLE